MLPDCSLAPPPRPENTQHLLEACNTRFGAYASEWPEAELHDLQRLRGMVWLEAEDTRSTEHRRDHCLGWAGPWAHGGLGHFVCSEQSEMKARAGGLQDLPVHLVLQGCFWPSALLVFILTATSY